MLVLARLLLVFAWLLHGSGMGLLRALSVSTWIVLKYDCLDMIKKCLGSAWIELGFCLDYAWVLLGLRSGSAWTVYGISWFVLDSCSGSASIVCAWNLGTCLDCAWVLCSVRAWNLL